MKIAIYSITATLFEGEAEKLIARTPQGEITVLDNHIPLVTPLMGPAINIIDEEGRTTNILLTGGVLDVRPESEVVVLAE